MRTDGLVFVTVTMALIASGAWAQAHSDARTGQVQKERRIMLAQQDGGAVAKARGVTGQAPYRFRVKPGPIDIRVDISADLLSAHGGFAVDHRPGKGETYFGLPNTGILRLSADMTRIDVLDASPELRDGVTMHNATIWYDAQGEAFLAFPTILGQTVLTTDLEGKLVHRLVPPTPDQMSVEPVKTYFADGKPFVPTDVEYLDGLYYMTTGYSPLDYVLTARITSTDPFDAQWNALAFGGKGDADGQFQTGHGITVTPDRRHLAVADRPKSRVERFTPEGAFVDQFHLPPGTKPCDVDYLGDFTLVPCLEGADKELGAPIYLMRDGEIVSTIMCKAELGLPRFAHVHNAVLREVDGRLYIIAQAWQPGDFVVLEQVVE